MHEAPLPRSHHQSQPTPRSGSGIGPQRALEAINQNPQRTARKPNPPRASSASAGPIPRSAPLTPSGAGSVRSEPWKRSPTIPRAQRESPILPRASSASVGPIPRSAPYAQRSGIGPQRALEAITKIPSAQRESPSSPELPQRAQDRSRGAHHLRQAERDRSAASLGSDHQSPSRNARKPNPPRASSARVGPIPRSAPYAQRSGIGPQRALEAITKIPSAQRESTSSLEPPQRAQDRSRGAHHLRPAERDRSVASLGSEQQNPQRAARKHLLPRASSARVGTIPRSPPGTQP